MLKKIKIVSGMLAVGLCLFLGVNLWLDDDADAAAIVPEGSGTINVKVTNLQNHGKGQLVALLYKKVSRVQINGVEYYKRQVLDVSGESINVEFKDIPYGEYAVAIMHDMDSNFTMAKTFVGIPDEDLGISNNVKGGPMGGPKWSAAKFVHKEENSNITPIEMWQCYQ